MASLNQHKQLFPLFYLRYPRTIKQLHPLCGNGLKSYFSQLQLCLVAVYHINSHIPRPIHRFVHPSSPQFHQASTQTAPEMASHSSFFSQFRARVGSTSGPEGGGGVIIYMFSYFGRPEGTFRGQAVWVGQGKNRQNNGR